MSLLIRRRPCDHWGREWSSIIAKEAWSHRRIEKARNRFSLRTSAGNNPPGFLVSVPWNGFHTLGLWNDELIHLCCFKFVVIHYSSLSKLTQFPCHRACQEQAQCLKYCKFCFYSLPLLSKPPKLGGACPIFTDLSQKKMPLLLREKESLTSHFT